MSWCCCVTTVQATALAVELAAASDVERAAVSTVERAAASAAVQVTASEAWPKCGADCLVK